MKAWAIGLTLATLFAVPLGMLFGAVDVLYRASRFTIDFLRSVPPVSIIPLAILMYGATVKMAIFLIIFAAGWPLLLQTVYGIHEVDPLVRDVAASYQLRLRRRALVVSLPSAAPFMATGLRLAATFSLLIAVGAGVIGGAPGVGAAIVQAEQTGHVPEMFVYIVTAGLLGLLINLIMSRLERRVLFWHHAYRGTRAT
jgi:ABC-type nitrate/sulfonate/bicarbonate transport system permease component